MIIYAVGLDRTDLPEGSEEGRLLEEGSDLAQKTFEEAVGGMTITSR
jgi:hypothetical protein